MLLAMIEASTPPTPLERFSREEVPIRGSDRAFGITVAAVLMLIALVKWWHSGQAWRWLGIAAVLFLAAALFYPRALALLNRCWFQFGLLLHKVISPLVMGIVFYGAVLPTGL